MRTKVKVTCGHQGWELMVDVWTVDLCSDRASMFFLREGYVNIPLLKGEKALIVSTGSIGELKLEVCNA